MRGVAVQRSQRWMCLTICSEAKCPEEDTSSIFESFQLLRVSDSLSGSSKDMLGGGRGGGGWQACWRRGRGVGVDGKLSAEALGPGARTWPNENYSRALSTEPITRTLPNRTCFFESQGSDCSLLLIESAPDLYQQNSATPCAEGSF